MGDGGINWTKCTECHTEIEFQVSLPGEGLGTTTGFTCPKTNCGALITNGSRTLRYRVKGEEKWTENNP
jgi:hypothetical protein